MDSTLLMLKLIFIFIFGVGALLSGLFPISASIFKKSIKWANIGICFSGGIILTVGLVDLFPEAIENVADALDSDFPLPSILVICSYTLMLFLEKIVFTKSHSHVFHDEKEEEEHDDRTPLIYVSTRRRCNSAPINRPDETQSMISFDETPTTKADEKDEDSNGIITGLILALALGIHNLFEGIAIGLQKDVSSFIGIATAVILHHFFAAFSLGINIKGLKKSKSLPMLGSFVLSEPCGIAIGIGLSSLEVPLLNGVFLSLCVGTFIYISSSDILAEEFSITKQKYTKFVAYICGVIVFLILLVGIERTVE